MPGSGRRERGRGLGLQAGAGRIHDGRGDGPDARELPEQRRRLSRRPTDSADSRFRRRSRTALSGGLDGDDLARRLSEGECEGSCAGVQVEHSVGAIGLSALKHGLDRAARRRGCSPGRTTGPRGSSRCLRAARARNPGRESTSTPAMRRSLAGPFGHYSDQARVLDEPSREWLRQRSAGTARELPKARFRHLWCWCLTRSPTRVSPRS